MKERQIWVFGNPDKSELGFPDRADLEKYIANDIFEKEAGRYRYTLARFAEVIVMSRDGLAFGHFDISEKVKPTDHDRAEYPKVKHVYLVSSSTLYEEPVQLSKLDIKLGRFGKRLSEDEFSQLLIHAGKVKAFSGAVRLPDSPAALDKLLQSVRRRLGQSEFREGLINAYNGSCAVTDCDVVDALEAAHIIPHCEDDSHSSSDGLLLRADIHTLFDHHLIGIDPASKTIVIAEKLTGTCYAELNGKPLAQPKDAASEPKVSSLATRWERFLNEES